MSMETESTQIWHPVAVEELTAKLRSLQVTWRGEGFTAELIEQVPRAIDYLALVTPFAFADLADAYLALVHVGKLLPAAELGDLAVMAQRLEMSPWDYVNRYLIYDRGAGPGQLLQAGPLSYNRALHWLAIRLTGTAAAPDHCSCYVYLQKDAYRHSDVLFEFNQQQAREKGSRWQQLQARGWQLSYGVLPRGLADEQLNQDHFQVIGEVL